MARNDLLWMLLTVCGALTVICAYRDSGWFMDSAPAQLFVRLLGRGGARLLYGILGVTLIVVSLLSTV